MNSIKTIKDIEVIGKKVLLRCDFNVPVDEKGNILDDYRIKQAIPTIKFLIEKKAKVIIMSHLDPESTGVADKKYTLDRVGERLAEYLNMDIAKADGCIGPEIEGNVTALKDGQVMLLENLRFYKEETSGDLDFAKKLSYLGEVYVNEAFSVCHRAHASIIGIPQFLPHCMGLLLEKEITTLDKIMRAPEKPMVAIVGGTKVETKSKFINNISEVSDFVLISGLLKKEVDEKGIQFKYPEKVIGPVGELGALDINEESIKLFHDKIISAKTVLWNGPFGKFEDAEYARGTLAIANAIIESGAFSVVGGGETVEFLEKQGMIDKFGHVSTGGGAMLNYLSGDILPGIVALQQA